LVSRTAWTEEPKGPTRWVTPLGAGLTVINSATSRENWAKEAQSYLDGTAAKIDGVNPTDVIDRVADTKLSLVVGTPALDGAALQQCAGVVVTDR
jgi:hypothetical protein